MVVISCCTPQLEDLPELIHRIQSLLPAKEAARTCILSKSWLHACSTIPTLRFPCQSLTSYNKLIDSTLVRYHRDNLPIQCFDLVFDIRDQKSASLANKWIFGVASKSALKELFLSIWVEIDSFTLPDDIFSKISSIEQNDILEIDDVPSLGFIRYTDYLNKPLPFNMDSLGSVTHLDISGVVLDNAFFDMIKSNFPFLESLSLEITSRGLGSIVITSLPLKRLTLQFWVDIMTIDVQVYAPKLLFFFYAGRETVPSLSFPIIAPEEIKLRLNLKKTIDRSFFIKRLENSV
ncbi:F-box/LRR-repeat protein [Tanacetum coccineum]|uniref:F-box/LRR-repeat protein n=1 Tax=Tanacetum coccineum TaxID=301880 RepID=A0ABQ5I4P0_9ASTR